MIGVWYYRNFIFIALVQEDRPKNLLEVKKYSNSKLFLPLPWFDLFTEDGRWEWWCTTIMVYPTHRLNKRKLNMVLRKWNYKNLSLQGYAFKS